jgi:hypothetical protein
VIITCGTEKTPHATQPVAHVVGYPFGADSLGDFHQVTAGAPIPLPVRDCDINTRPALAFCNGTTIFAYRSTSGSLNVAHGMFDGSPKFSDPISVTNYPINDGPSLTVLKNTFHIAYVGHEGIAVVQNSVDGANWSAPANVPVRPVHGPSLCADPHDEQLRLMYVQAGGTRIYSVVSSDGINWSSPVEHPDASTSAAPAVIGSAAGLLLCVYKSDNNDNLYSTYTKQNAYIMN